MKLLIYLALGGIAGTFARYLLGTQLQPQGASFPWATLAINVAGSFILGLVMRSTAGTSAVELRTGITVGFCGAFTTMSTFAYESVVLVQGGQLGKGAIYLVASACGSILAALAGMFAGGKLAA